MPIGVATIKKMIEMGGDIHDLLEIAESMELSTAKERSSGAKRQAEYRSRKKLAALTSDVTGDVTESVTESVTPRVRVVDNLPTKEIAQKVRKKTPREDEADFKDQLAELGPELLEEFVKFRRKRRASLTGFSATLFLKDCAACDLTVTEAAEMCMGRNWHTVRPEFLANKKPSQTAPPGTINGATLATMWHDENLGSSSGTGNGKSDH